MKATDRQMVVAIRDYVEEHGYSPSFRDLGAAVGIVSAGSVKYRLSSLRDKGLLTYDDLIPRTIRLTEDGEALCG